MRYCFQGKFWVLTAALVSGVATQAQTTFSAEAIATAGSAADGEQFFLQPGPVVASALAVSGGNSARAQSAATAGRVGVYSSVETVSGFSASTRPAPYPTPLDASYSTRAGFDAPISLAAPGLAALNLNLNGRISWSDASSSSIYARASFYSLSYTFIGDALLEIQFLNGNITAGGYTYSSALDASYRVTGSGLFSAYSGMTFADPTNLSLNLTTASVLLPSDFRLLLGLEIGTNAGSGGAATFDFYNSLTLSTSGPVFSFTSGPNTANAADLNLVDNLYVVPEPGSVALIAGVLSLGLVCVLRRRRG